VIVGMKQRRIKTLLQADINLFAYHLPLDVHSDLGNNAQLAKLFGWGTPQPLHTVEPLGIVMGCTLAEPMDSVALGQHIERCLQRPLTVRLDCPQDIRRIAWCNGGGQSYIDYAADAGCYAFICGENMETSIPSVHVTVLA